MVDVVAIVEETQRSVGKGLDKKTSAGDSAISAEFRNQCTGNLTLQMAGLTEYFRESRELVCPLLAVESLCSNEKGCPGCGWVCWRCEGWA